MKGGATIFYIAALINIMKKYRFSVIISAYNVEKYIERAILSVIEQDFKDYEVIVVEDKSTDNTLKEIEKYKAKIKIIKNNKNKGLGATRNIGVSKAKGEYILYLDGDDTLYEKTTLSKIDKLIGKNNPDIVFLGYQEINGNNQLRISTKENSTKEARLSCDANFSACSKCWRKAFLDENNIKFMEGIYYEDMVYSMKAVTLSDNTMYGDFPIFDYYKNREGSIMTTPKIRRCTDMYKMLAYLMEIYQDAPKNLKPYILSFIINETKDLPARIKGILNAIEKNESAPTFPKREYKFTDLKDI